MASSMVNNPSLCMYKILCVTFQLGKASLSWLNDLSQAGMRAMWGAGHAESEHDS